MPPLPQSVALHIGAHKTASTHLQKTLKKNRKMLQDEGVKVYGPWYLRMQGRSLASMFDLSWSDTPTPRRNHDEQLRFLAKGTSRLVFSEENFGGILRRSEGRVMFPLYATAPEKLAEFAAACAPIEPQIFLAVRNPASFLASAYSQALFGGAFIGPQAFRTRNDWREVDWADYVTRLRAVRGIGKIYVWRQEDYDLAQTLILRRLLRWNVAPKVETIEGRVHQGLSGLAIRQTLSWAKEGETVKLAERARKLFPIEDGNRAFELFSKSVQAEATQVYDAQIAQIDAMDRVTVLHPPTEPAKG